MEGHDHHTDPLRRRKAGKPHLHDANVLNHDEYGFGLEHDIDADDTRLFDEAGLQPDGFGMIPCDVVIKELTRILLVRTMERQKFLRNWHKNLSSTMLRDMFLRTPDVQLAKRKGRRTTLYGQYCAMSSTEKAAVETSDQLGMAVQEYNTLIASTNSIEIVLRQALTEALP
eukprot:5006793-Amphidinium_carterae.3